MKQLINRWIIAFVGLSLTAARADYGSGITLPGQRAGKIEVRFDVLSKTGNIEGPNGDLFAFGRQYTDGDLYELRMGHSNGSVTLLRWRSDEFDEFDGWSDGNHGRLETSRQMRLTVDLSTSEVTGQIHRLGDDSDMAPDYYREGFTEGYAPVIEWVWIGLVSQSNLEPDTRHLVFENLEVIDIPLETEETYPDLMTGSDEEENLQVSWTSTAGRIYQMEFLTGSQELETFERLPYWGREPDQLDLGLTAKKKKLTSEGVSNPSIYATEHFYESKTSTEKPEDEDF